MAQELRLPRPSLRKPKLRIFLSYRRADAAGYSNSLYQSLVAAFGDEQVFKDVNAIMPGENWEEALDETITTCDVVVAVIGPVWLSSSNDSGPRIEDGDDWLRRELERALARDIPVVPALVGGARLPAESELPATLRPLVKRQAIELHDASWTSDVDRLVKALKDFARQLRDPYKADDVGAILNQAVKHWQAVPHRARLVFLIALAALVILLIGVGFVFEWALVAAAILAVVWLVTKFRGGKQAG